MENGVKYMLDFNSPIQGLLRLHSRYGPPNRSAAQRRPLSRGSNPHSYPHEPLVSYRINQQLSGWILPPLMIRAFEAHCQYATSHGDDSQRSPSVRASLVCIRRWNPLSLYQRAKRPHFGHDEIEERTRARCVSHVAVHQQIETHLQLRNIIEEQHKIALVSSKRDRQRPEPGARFHREDQRPYVVATRTNRRVGRH